VNTVCLAISLSRESHGIQQPLRSSRIAHFCFIISVTHRVTRFRIPGAIIGRTGRRAFREDRGTSRRGIIIGLYLQLMRTRS
jgi:hypothetical protein